MFSENLNIDSIGVNHELKLENSQCMGPCYLVLPCWNIFWKQTKFFFIYFLSQPVQHGKCLMNWSIHTETILEKRKTYDNEKKEIKMSWPGLTKLSGFQINPRFSPNFFFVIKTREMFKELTKIVNIFFLNLTNTPCLIKKKIKMPGFCPTSYWYHRRTRGFCNFPSPQ